MKTLIVLWIKWTEMVKIKHEDFIDAVPLTPCQNQTWIMGFRIYGEGRTQILLSSPTTVGSLVRIQDRKGLYWYKNCKIKNCNNTKINHIMVSFTDHYNDISIDRLPLKTKIRKISRYFDNYFLCKPEFSSMTKTFLFLLKTQNNNHSSAGDWW